MLRSNLWISLKESVKIEDIFGKTGTNWVGVAVRKLKYKYTLVTLSGIRTTNETKSLHVDMSNIGGKTKGRLATRWVDELVKVFGLSRIEWQKID